MTTSGPPLNEVAEEENEDEASTTHIWLQILSQVHESRRKAAAGKQIVVVGEKRCGKSTLITKLKGLDDTKVQQAPSSGLEYSYLDVRDEVREEDSTRTHVWLVDGDSQHASLLRHAVGNLEALSNSLLFICVSMMQPATLLESAQTWLNAFEANVVNSVKQADEIGFAELQRALERSLKQNANAFGKLNVPDAAGTERPSAESAFDDDTKLEDGVLQRNLGVPIVLCVTKCDSISAIEKEYDLKDEHFDFIQVHLRRLALKYGATLIYTSAKEEKNLDAVLKYTMHRLYATRYDRSAYVVEKDCVFVPAGWDTPRKIAIMFENMTAFRQDTPFDDAFARQRLARGALNRPASNTALASSTANVAADVVVEDEQVFLTRMQSALTKAESGPQAQAQAPLGATQTLPQVAGTASPSSVTAQSAVADLTAAQLNSSPGSRAAPVARPSVGGQVPTNESVLANFFNSLLTKKGAGVAAPSTDGLSSELDRSGSGPGSARKPANMLNTSGASMDKEKENQTDQRTA